MDFQTLQNFALWRLRARGVNFGGAPANLATDQNPPAAVQALLNQAYGEFLDRTREARLPGTVLACTVATVQNATAYSLAPLPPAPGGAVQPAALEVVAVKYRPAGGATYPVDLVSAQEFLRQTGGGMRRLSWFGGRVYFATRGPLAGGTLAQSLEVAPGTATAGDALLLYVVPDVNQAPANLACSAGGPMVQNTDVPLVPARFHQALVEYVVAQAGPAMDLTDAAEIAAKRWEAYVDLATTSGMVPDGGQGTVALDRFSA